MLKFFRTSDAIYSHCFNIERQSIVSGFNPVLVKTTENIRKTCKLTNGIKQNVRNKKTERINLQNRRNASVIKRIVFANVTIYYVLSNCSNCTMSSRNVKKHWNMTSNQIEDVFG